MKSITILKDVSIPNLPGFKAGGKHRVADDIADILVDRDFAKFDSKTEEATDEEKQKNDESVHIKRTGGHSKA